MAGRTMTLPAGTLPEYQRTITQYTRGQGHTYHIEGLPCEHCANCKKNKLNERNAIGKKELRCFGMSGVGSVTGRYKTGNLYNAGRRGAFDIVFGNAETGTAGILPTDVGVTLGPEHIAQLRHTAETAPSRASVARDYGTAAHEAVELWLKYETFGDPMPFITEHVYAASKAIVDWLHKNEWEILDVETSVYHPQLLYVGTADCVAQRGDNIAIFDWKTGGGIYNNAALQVAAYGMAYAELTGQSVEQGWIIRSNPNGLEVLQVGNFDDARTMFRQLLEVRNMWDDFEWIRHLEM